MGISPKTWTSRTFANSSLAHTRAFCWCACVKGANALLESIAAMIQVNPLESLSGCFVVLTDHKLRIKRS
jgi:hypothetical protein